MFRCNRKSYFKGLGTFVVCFLISSGAIARSECVTVYKNNSEKTECYQTATELEAVLYQNQTHTTPYQHNCEAPKNQADADLCEQRRMAKAAEDLVKLTGEQLWRMDFQNWLIIGEIGLLIGTLGAAIWAAVAAGGAVREAKEATRIAKRATNIQEDAIKSLERPYVYIKIISTNQFKTLNKANHPKI